MMTNDEQQELETLQLTYSDLEPAVVQHVYIVTCHKNYKEAQLQLADLLANPQQLAAVAASAGQVSYSVSADSRRMQAGASKEAEPDDVNSPGLSTMASMGLANAPLDIPYTLSAATWNVTGLAETLTTVGVSMSDGISSLATNITGWVADLAAALDGAWGYDDGDGQMTPPPDKNAATSAVVASGVGLDRLYQRRHVSGGVVPDTTGTEAAELDMGEDGHKDD
ncbi:uncharacterized protein HaLaN_06425 [Haematococcus lacustris]|uniref:Uncharacterized protein n=1 Tax=Haematococcus lacustris TaxID=44745 RepID=A0A699YVY7_HAELA|nr:uncharacterized protein HaLaN_06425 [Haematococcus lacustris]